MVVCCETCAVCWLLLVVMVCCVLGVGVCVVRGLPLFGCPWLSIVVGVCWLVFLVVVRWCCSLVVVRCSLLCCCLLFDVCGLPLVVCWLLFVVVCYFSGLTFVDCFLWGVGFCFVCKCWLCVVVCCCLSVVRCLLCVAC